MEKDTQKNGQSAQGAESPKTLTENEVKKFLKRDIASCINLMDAIYQDEGTLDSLASFLYGRYMNSKHKEELEKQAKLEVN